MICRGCGADIRSQSARFCESCGVSLWDEDPMSRLAHGYRLEVEGRQAEAVRLFEEVLDDTDDAGLHTLVLKHLGNLHFRLGHLRRARRHLASALERDPSNPTLLHDLGVVCYHQADFDGAVTTFRRALANDPDLELAYFWLGNALYHAGCMDEAAAAFRDLLARYPNFTIAHFHLGVIEMRRGHMAQAEREFERVLAKNPKDAAARHYLERVRGDAAGAGAGERERV
jgi:tetratricopeptide (TPR) repeat protein